MWLALTSTCYRSRIRVRVPPGHTRCGAYVHWRSIRDALPLFFALVIRTLQHSINTAQGIWSSIGRGKVRPVSELSPPFALTRSRASLE